MSKSKHSGIYKITAPDGKIYIGKSRHINKRLIEYKELRCKQQPKIYNSLLQYGANTHNFEIVHYCDPSDLDCFERYYQDLYEVTGNFGLNRNLTNCFSGHKKERINFGISVTDTSTSIEYSSVTKASAAAKIPRRRFLKMLNNPSLNSTHFVFTENYLGEISPLSTLKITQGKSLKIIDTQTKIIYSSKEEVKNIFGIPISRLKGLSISSKMRNTTTFMLFSEYEKMGAIPSDDAITNKDKVIDTNFEIIYKNVAEAANAIGMDFSNLSKRLKGKLSNYTGLVYFSEYHGKTNQFV